MGTVTIAATYGAGGSVIAPAVAERLGLPLVERAIPVPVAERIHEPLQAALADDTEHSTMIGRVLDSSRKHVLFIGMSDQGAMDCRIVALGATTRENQFARIGAN